MLFRSKNIDYINEATKSLENLNKKLIGIEERQKELRKKVKRLPEKYAELLMGQISHEEELIEKIPKKGDINAEKASGLLSLQSMIILKLKEQIQLRDNILNQANSDVSKDLYDNPKIIKYEEPLKFSSNQSYIASGIGPELSAVWAAFLFILCFLAYTSTLAHTETNLQPRW